MNFYEEALLNIKWAKENECPPDTVEKLNKREVTILEEQKKEVKDPGDDVKNFFTLSYPANPKIPFIVECLELKTTEKYGRGIYTKQNLEPGDFIAIEESVISMHKKLTNKPPAGYLSCVHCMKSCMRNLIPCTKTGENLIFLIKLN